MTLAIDGHVFVNSGASASLTTGTLSCSSSGNEIVAFITTNGGPVTSVTDTSGITSAWAKRGASSVGSTIEEWATKATGTFSGTITVNTTSSAFISVDVCGVSGTNNTFDGSAVTGTSDPLSITTTNANTIIFGAYRMSSGTSTQGAGWTLLNSAGFQIVEYKIVSATQSGLSVAIGTGAGTANGGVADAIVAASVGGFFARVYYDMAGIG